MMEGSPERASLPLDVAKRVDAVCDRFEDAWVAGRKPKIEQYLSELAEPDRPALLRELLRVEMECRFRSGDTPGAEEYQARFPDHSELVSQVYQNVAESTSVAGRSATDRVPETVAYREGEAAATETHVRTEQRTPVGSEAAQGLPEVAGYEILSELGRGGMGVVYRAWQKSLKREVALKMILAGSHAGAERLARFQAEAEAVAQLEHPNIVHIYEVGEHAGAPFFSLEFVDGESLHKKLGGKPMEAPDAAQLVETLARSVQYAHQRGIVHRDLKPENVLLTPEGVPKITDFGLAKRLEEDSGQTKSGSVIGTPSYMAPEQARGAVHEVGPLADVYALGAILYKLLTGRPPFMAANPVDTVMQVLDDEPVAPGRLQPKVPADLETICLKCLQKDAQRRYGSAEQLAEDLRRFSAGEPILARPVSNWERAWRWCRRNPRVAVPSAAAVLLALTVVIGSPIAVLRINKEKAGAIENARQAKLAQKDAEAAQQVAEEQADLALDACMSFVVAVRGHLSGRPDTQDIRKELLNIAAEKLDAVARQGAVADSADKETAKVFQLKGLLHEDLGQTSLALEQHQSAHEVIEALAAENPDNPIEAKHNLAATNNKLGDMCLQLGKLDEARRHYEAGLKLGTEWLESDPEALQAKLDVANSLALVGNVILLLGDPATARDYFIEAGRRRLGLPKRVQAIPERQREMAGVYDKLAHAMSRLGEAAEAEKRYNSALAARQTWAKSRPELIRYKQDLIVSHRNLGDLRLCVFKDPQAAHEHYQQAMTILEALEQSDPRSAYVKRALSMMNYRLGTVSLRLGEPDQAKRRFDACLEHREALAEESPEDVRAQIDLMTALARCGQHERAAGIADELCERFPRNPWALYHAACGYSLCAAAAPDAKTNGRPGDQQQSLQQPYAEKALEALRQAIEHGWKASASLEDDPDLDAVREQPDFPALIEQVKKAAAGAEKQASTARRPSRFAVGLRRPAGVRT